MLSKNNKIKYISQQPNIFYVPWIMKNIGSIYCRYVEEENFVIETLVKYKSS